MQIKHELMVEMSLKQLRRFCLEEEVRITDLFDSGLLLELGPDRFVLTVSPLKQSEAKERKKENWAYRSAS